MFKRDPATYSIDESVVSNILRDPANPLNRIAELIPSSSRILDVGAGNGLLARLLQKKNKDVIIDGIEPDTSASQQARKFYRTFHVGYVQDCLEQIASERYDYIVFADVVEHIVDPLPLLTGICASIDDHAKIILSIPNVAFGAVRMALMAGNFIYVDSGLLEKTHVRFYTLQTIRTLMSFLPLHVEKLYHLQHDVFKTEITAADLRVPFSCLRSVLKDDLSSTYQFLLVLTKKKVETEELRFGEKTTMYRAWRFYVKRNVKKLFLMKRQFT
jgi:2-polyprenyl-3-methyl-5-hydroxy-6-metoxy-1,4-benzoquinol methylase